ncbi:MAG: transcription antitermination factor NusB [Desulfovibrio sp.]|uniref:transcription antitermination factor NusB n=1 Tax=Desulfovibrio sp. TaxID=885 RepID=UPI0039E489BD
MSKAFKQRDFQLRGLPLNGRTAALRALLLTDQGQSAQQALASVLEARAEHKRESPLKDKASVLTAGLSAQDRALCTELVYGCLRTEIRLDFILSTVLRRPQDLPRPMRLILAIAVYGLMFQDKVPAHAVIHEAVDQVRRLFGQGLSRVANGALRSLQRAGQQPLQQAFYAVQNKGGKAQTSHTGKQSFSGQCVFYSVPLWIGNMWRDAYGEHAALDLLRRSFERPYSALRINAGHPQARKLYDALARSAEFFAAENAAPSAVARDLADRASQGTDCMPGAGAGTGTDTIGHQDSFGEVTEAPGFHIVPGVESVTESIVSAADDNFVAPVRIGQWGLAFAAGQLPREALGFDLRYWQSQGALSWQSAGSQMALLELGLDSWREPVWDACAGYGGKSMALMEWGVPVGLCTDRSMGRLRGLPAQCATLKLPQPAICIADATQPPVKQWHGHILVDAPCSGLGVLARRPDIRRREPQHLAELEVLQRAMLCRLASILQPGRELAYITCTLNPSENEKAVEYLAENNNKIKIVRQWQTSHGHPWLEGMYGALLRKES